jgi:hypothetical protein
MAACAQTERGKTMVPLTLPSTSAEDATKELLGTSGMVNFMPAMETWRFTAIGRVQGRDALSTTRMHPPARACPPPLSPISSCE